MYKLLEKFDDLAGINQTDYLSLWLDRIAFTFLTLMILSAPHSIAATLLKLVVFISPNQFSGPTNQLLLQFTRGATQPHKSFSLGKDENPIIYSRLLKG